MWFNYVRMSRGCRILTAVALAFLAVACNEDGTVTVHSLKFNGVRSIDETRLKNALATRENTKVPLVGWQLPWSRRITSIEGASMPT